MANEECAGQAQACLIRVARLDPTTGAPLAGDGNLYVTEAMISLEWSPDIATGDELEATNGCGEECVYFRADDRVRKLDLTLTLCTPAPELIEMLAGGTIHALSAVTTGYGLPAPGAISTGDTSIELWEKIIVDQSVAGHARHVLPRTRGWRQTGETFQNDVLSPVLEGFGVQAGAWGDGPGGDWSDLSDEDVVFKDWALEANALPVAVCGSQALVLA